MRPSLRRHDPDQVLRVLRPQWPCRPGSDGSQLRARSAPRFAANVARAIADCKGRWPRCACQTDESGIHFLGKCSGVRTLERIATRWNRTGALARLSPCGPISRQCDDGRALVSKAGSLLVWSHFPRRTGVHFVRKFSSGLSRQN